MSMPKKTKAGILNLPTQLHHYITTTGIIISFIKISIEYTSISLAVTYFVVAAANEALPLAQIKIFCWD